ncbi:MAG: RNA-binding S4 domain-containing protein [Ruminococcaceae bacterium]|nr:RNA-binding S4 domain-containing protein [Oscillospiraceae bacterium]
MRIDKYLKVSRIIKRRTVAQEACEGGKVTINGKVAKPSSEVKVGDVLTLQFGARCVRVEVLEVKEVVKKDDASLMYRQLEG